MKLKEYVPVYADKFARFDRAAFHNFVEFIRDNHEYNSLEAAVLWNVYQRLNRQDNFALYDEIRAKYPDVNDSHILTMLKAAFKRAIGSDVETFVNTAL